MLLTKRETAVIRNTFRDSLNQIYALWELWVSEGATGMGNLIANVRIFDPEPFPESLLL